MSGSLAVDEPLVVLAGLEPPLARAVSAAFARERIATLVVDGTRAASAVSGRRVTAVVLDASACGGDAPGACRRLRDSADQVPVLALTPGAVEERVGLLDAGADDCLSKPFASRELMSRLRAVQRRTMAPREPTLLEYADLRVDVGARQAWRGGRDLELTPTEFALLALLTERAELVIGRREILISVWGYDFGPDFGSLGVYVGYVRRKLEAAGEPRLLQTVRGVGYVLRA